MEAVHCNLQLTKMIHELEHRTEHAKYHALLFLEEQEEHQHIQRMAHTENEGGRQEEIEAQETAESLKVMAAKNVRNTWRKMTEGVKMTSVEGYKLDEMVN